MYLIYPICKLYKYLYLYYYIHFIHISVKLKFYGQIAAGQFLTAEIP